jgi:beta-glucanase (GH16 family)
MRINITLSLLCLSVCTLLACSGKKENVKPTASNTNTSKPDIPVDKGWEFETSPSFTDEFDNNGKPDPTKWGYDTGGNGWGNNELEYYTDLEENAHIEGGNLTISALKEAYISKNYTSARLISKGNGSLQYGRIEVRAKLPAGRGTWPAIWMLPNDNSYGDWPNSGEIDIMEMVGFDPGNVHFTVHNQTYYGANGRGSNLLISTATSDFHKYKVDWTPYAIKGYYDDVLIFTYINTGAGSSVWPYDQKFHLLMNIAVGGSWGGVQGVDDNVFPAAMQIDYVRFYKMIPK